MSDQVPLMLVKTIVSFPPESNEFCLFPMKKRAEEPPVDMEKNEELLAEEREGLKYILPAAKLIEIYRE